MKTVYERSELIPQSVGDGIAICLDLVLRKIEGKLAVPEWVSTSFMSDWISAAIDELQKPTGRIFDYDDIEVNMVGYLERKGDQTLHPVTITCEYKDAFRAYEVGHDSVLLDKVDYGITWRLWTLPFPLSDDDESCKWPKLED